MTVVDAASLPMIAIISDTHLPRGARHLPDACLEHLRAAELILHAGDLFTLGVLHGLEALGPPVRAVAGNVDEPDVQRTLPAERVVEHRGARIGMVHDAGPRSGRLVRLRRRFAGCIAVVFGHSHLPLCERDVDGFTIVNPGSPTERRRAPTHTMAVAIVEPAGIEIRLISLD